MLQKYITFFILLLLQFICYSQQFINLDFETIDNNSHLPKNWFIVEENNCAFQVDSNIQYSGKISFLLTPKKKSQNGYASLLNELNQEIFVKRKTVSITAHIKLRNQNDSAVAILCRQLSSKGKELSMSNIHSAIATDFKDGWRKLYYESQIDSSTRYLAFGINIRLSDSVWLDKFEVAFDKIPVKDLNPILEAEPTQVEKAWLNKNIIPLHCSDSSGSNKLDSIIGIMKKERIIALGEVTHGSSEIYKIKDKILRHLFEKMNCSVLAMEMDAYDAETLNSYIVDNKGDPRTILAQTGYWPWKTEEFLKLLEWMNQYNKVHTRKLQIKGFDISFSTYPTSVIRKFAEKYDRTLLPYLDSISNLYNLKGYGVVSQKHKVLLKCINKLTEYFTSRYKIYATRSSRGEIDFTKHAIRNVWQYVTYLFGESDKDTFRDQCMAENLTYIFEKNPLEKIILWAHNFHISKNDSSMGSFIKKQYPFYSIGFSLGFGYFNATNDEDGNKSVQPYPLLPPLNNSYESYFLNADVPVWFLNLKKVGMDNKWLLKKHLFRFSGSKFSRYQFSETNIMDDFDAIIFIKKSTPSHLIFYTK